MSKHPINLAVRFILETVAIMTFGVWGYRFTDSRAGILLAIILPVFFALIWGVFAVRNDPSRSGKTVVPTPGVIRLMLELGLFGAATWMLFNLDYSITGSIFAGIILMHYAISYDRIDWLLKQK